MSDAWGGSWGAPSAWGDSWNGAAEGEELPARRVSFVQQPAQRRRRDLIARTSFEIPVGARLVAQCRFLPVIRDNKASGFARVGARAQGNVARQRACRASSRVAIPAAVAQVARRWGLEATFAVGARWASRASKAKHTPFGPPKPLANAARERRQREEAMLLGIPLDDAMLL